MGLNDLTLEKLIGEINGYKLKMQTLYEDYGHAAQDLQDRINVLGYNLNEQLKDVKDSISSTPQRLLTLETKYVSGEVNEQEYRLQRGEFKSLLQHNLHTIEDIKAMINVLSTIEARPLGPAEIRQAPSNLQAQPTVLQTRIPSNLTPRAYGPAAPTEDRNRPNSFPERPTYVAQLPAQQPAPEPTPVATWTQPQRLVSTFPFADQPQASSEPAAPQPIQPSESSLKPEAVTAAVVSEPTPTPTVPPVALPTPTEAAVPEQLPTLVPAPTLETPLAVTPVIQDSPATIEPTVPEPRVEPLVEHEPAENTPTAIPQPNAIATEPSLETVAPAPEQALPETLREVTTPTIAEPEAPEIVNIDNPLVGAAAEDALMVKVVDDIPVVDASAAVATGTESQLQSPLVGGGVSTEAISSGTISSDVAQVSSSQPNAFYNVVCPKCGADVRQPAKVWELKGGKSKKNVLIGLFQCQDCRVKFREALTREII